MFQRPRLLFALHCTLLLGTAVLCYLTYRHPNPSSVPSDTGADMMLRRFQDIKSMRVEYRLPAGYEYGALKVMRYENGKRVRHEMGFVLTTGTYENGYAHFQLMWGKIGDKTRVATESVGITTSTGSDDFWLSLNGVTIPGRDSKKETMDGYEVVAFAESDEFTDPNRVQTELVGDAQRATALKQRVIVLGVKPCGTKREAEHLVYGSGD
jgi:hypothetical protein